MLEHALLYFIPEKGEFLKIQPGTGDNLLREDIKEGYTDYVLWSTFKPESLDIDGELDMECLDSGMLLIKESSPANNGELISEILQQAYDNQKLNTILLLK